MFRDFDHWKKYSTSPLFAELAEGYYEKSGGNKVVAITYYGERHVTSNKAINKPEDMKGLKIRVPDAPLYTMFPRAVGANPTPIAFAEVYLALQNGTVDAQENPLPTIDAKKFYEVQKYIVLTGHITDALLTIVAGRRGTSSPTPTRRSSRRCSRRPPPRPTARSPPPRSGWSTSSRRRATTSSSSTARVPRGVPEDHHADRQGLPAQDYDRMPHQVDGAPRQAEAEKVIDDEGHFHVVDEAVDLSGTIAEDWAAFGLFWVLALTVFYQFFTRYALNDSASWTEEIARYLLIGVVFVGAAIDVRKNNHIQVDFFYRFMPRGARPLAVDPSTCCASPSSATAVVAHRRS